MALPQVSEEMASAAAVAAKDCYRGGDEAMRGERRARRDTETRKNQIYSQKMQDCFFFFNVPMFYNRGGGRGQKKGKIKKCKGKSEIATAAKTRLVTDDKKMLSSHRVPDGGALLIPRFFILFLPGGEKKWKKKSHQNAYLLFDSSAGE